MPGHSTFCIRGSATYRHCHLQSVTRPSNPACSSAALQRHPRCPSCCYVPAPASIHIHRWSLPPLLRQQHPLPSSTAFPRFPHCMCSHQTAGPVRETHTTSPPHTTTTLCACFMIPAISSGLHQPTTNTAFFAQPTARVHPHTTLPSQAPLAQHGVNRPHRSPTKPTNSTPANDIRRSNKQFLLHHRGEELLVVVRCFVGV